MRPQSAKGHGSGVRLPRQLLVGHPFEQLPRRANLVIVFRQQSVLDHRGHRACGPAPVRLGGLTVTVLSVSLIASACSAACGRRAAPPPLRALSPQVSGTLAVDGLSTPVRVVRDRWGVPHIRAGNQDDLFFAQGFVQAQDRLFQMDLWRRSVQGRLSEVLGPNFIDRDAMTRRVQYRGALDVEWASYGPDTRAIASAFTRGINAWVGLARERSPEEFVLAGWAPEFWRPEDLLNRTDAFVSSHDAQDEVFRARLVTAVGAARADRLLPAARGPTVVPRGLDEAVVSYFVADVLRRIGTAPFFVGLAAPLPSDGGGGSNAWAVARGDAGAPL